MLETPLLAMSSGSACTSADPRPSHVLEAIGRSVEESRSSLRFGIGRYNTSDEIQRAAELLIEAERKLRKCCSHPGCGSVTLQSLESSSP